MQSIRFILYEPSFLIRKGLITVIDKIANSKLIAQADNEEELTELLNQEDADILIVNESAFKSKEIVKQLKHLSGVQIISLTMHKHSKTTDYAVTDTVNIEDTQKIILKKINALISNNISKKNIEKKPDEISNREADILKYIALGFSNKEIADKLFLSAHTVVTHRKNITRKLGIKTVPGLTIYAIINKIIDINDTGKLNPDSHK